jgi:hypothetical protein
MTRRKVVPIIIGAVVGGVAGFLYYRFVGCRSGVCIITGNRYLATIYGAILGGLVANLLK